MNMKLKLIVALALLCNLHIGAQGIDFFHGTFDEAKAKAKAEDKLIFVDAYAEWCGPCKKMAANVFTKPKAGDFFNSNFINLKIDMEKEENAVFAGQYPVSAYPTLMVLDAEGKLAQKKVGAMEVEDLIEFGKKAIGKTDKSGEYEQQYNEGKRDPEFLLQYVSALNRAGKPSLKITNEYLNAQTDLTTPFNQKFILEGATEADSRVFDLLIKNRALIATTLGEQAVRAKIEKACSATVRKAVEFKDPKLLAEAKGKMKQHVPDRAVAFADESDLKYVTATQDAAGYLKVMKSRQKAAGDSAAKLNELAFEMLRAFPADMKVLKQAAKWADAAAKKGGLPEYYLTSAEIYRTMGDKKKARAAAEAGKKAIGAEDTKGFGQKFDYFLERLN
jgi:thiol-disulfide isomerase/thioredoxin